MRQAVGVRVGYFVKYVKKKKQEKTEGRVLALVRREKGRMQIWNVCHKIYLVYVLFV